MLPTPGNGLTALDPSYAKCVRAGFSVLISRCCFAEDIKEMYEVL